MICPNCGKTIDDNATVCPECGGIISPLGTAPATTAAAAAAAPVVVVDPQNAPKNVKQFVKSLADKKIAKEINGSSIIMYVCAAITLLAGVLQNNYLVLIDVILLIGLGIWLHTSYSRVPAILTTIYGVINVIATYIQTKTFGGWLVLVAGIIALIYTSKAKKAYKDYLKGVGQAVTAAAPVDNNTSGN